jgi:hypothetical protein
MYAPPGDASRHCVHGQDRSVIPEQDKQSGAVFKPLHGLRRVRLRPIPSGTRLRPRPDERVKIPRHENVSNDSESQFLLHRTNLGPEQEEGVTLIRIEQVPFWNFIAQTWEEGRHSWPYRSLLRLQAPWETKCCTARSSSVASSSTWSPARLPGRTSSNK